MAVTAYAGLGECATFYSKKRPLLLFPFSLRKCPGSHCKSPKRQTSQRKSANYKRTCQTTKTKILVSNSTICTSIKIKTFLSGPAPHTKQPLKVRGRFIDFIQKASVPRSNAPNVPIEIATLFIGTQSISPHFMSTSYPFPTIQFWVLELIPPYSSSTLPLVRQRQKQEKKQQLGDQQKRSQSDEVQLLESSGRKVLEQIYSYRICGSAKGDWGFLETLVNSKRG